MKKSLRNISIIKSTKSTRIRSIRRRKSTKSITQGVRRGRNAVEVETKNIIIIIGQIENIARGAAEMRTEEIDIILRITIIPPLLSRKILKHHYKDLTHIKVARCLDSLLHHDLRKVREMITRVCKLQGLMNNHKLQHIKIPKSQVAFLNYVSIFTSLNPF